jgi:hypothetical protein
MMEISGLHSCSVSLGCTQYTAFIYWLKICFWQEFVALPRADAIQLLMQYDGDAETVIQQIFQ